MKLRKLKSIVLKYNKNLVDKITTTTYKDLFIIYLSLFLLGRGISLYKNIEYSIVHQVNLTIISIVELNILREFYSTISVLLKEFHGRNQTLYFIILKLKSKIYSIYNILIPTIFGAIFAWIVMFLGYLPNNFIGYFGLFMATSSFFFALIAYYALIWTLITFYKISKIPYKELFYVHPNDTIRIPVWLKCIIDLFFKAKTAVFTVGLLYTIEYLILVPSSSFELTPEFKINSEYPVLFLYNWVVIVIFVIIACPIIMELFKYFLSIIIENSKQNAIDYVDGIWAQTQLDINGLVSYQQTIKNLSETGMYHIPSKNLYPIITTSLAFVLNIFKFIELLSPPV